MRLLASPQAGFVTLFDLSHPLGEGTPVYPGDPPVSVTPLARHGAGDGYEAHEVRLSSHAGTHVDAPAHVLPGGTRLDELPLEVWIGPARLLDLAEVLVGGTPGERRLLVAGCENGLPLPVALALADLDLLLVGIDGPSADAPGSTDLPVHRALLAEGIVIVENLRLTGIPRGPGTLYCLPLPLEGGDGAPARVLWEPDAAAGNGGG